MKKQDIRNIYTDTVMELLYQGYTIFPDTMGSSQNDIAHIDLCNGSEIVRVLLYRAHCYYRDEGYIGETLNLLVGKISPDAPIFNNWQSTVWNDGIEVYSETQWAWIGSDTEHDWYVDMDEGKRISAIQMKRLRAQIQIPEELGDEYKQVLLKWIQKQPRMKTCKLEDITKVLRVYDEIGNKKHYEVFAKGKKYVVRY